MPQSLCLYRARYRYVSGYSCCRIRHLRFQSGHSPRLRPGNISRGFRGFLRSLPDSRYQACWSLLLSVDFSHIVAIQYVTVVVIVSLFYATHDTSNAMAVFFIFRIVYICPVTAVTDMCSPCFTYPKIPPAP